MAGVYYLRTVADVEMIRVAAHAGRRAVIIGGGYIGLETAASLRALGLEVTVLEGRPGPDQRPRHRGRRGLRKPQHGSLQPPSTPGVCAERARASQGRCRDGVWEVQEDSGASMVLVGSI
ncbi:ferredoxin reductase [Mycobacteroides abscessus subsp. abscessus]|nr:ferredoxin reductase [Mycobacteroides abscessus subsp. abscessus]